MLVLEREIGQRIWIGDDIVIELVRIKGEKAARIGISAPKDVAVHREEVYKEIQKTLRRAPGADPTSCAAAAGD